MPCGANAGGTARASRCGLQANRAAFVALHTTLRELSCQFAAHASLLEAVVRSMHLDVPLGALASPVALAEESARLAKL